uniref:Uncharacterized protein n=1 Tax=Esox lucius TaxID=8010 RepID=A0A6Q2XWV3_ESOLU
VVALILVCGFNLGHFGVHRHTLHSVISLFINNLIYHVGIRRGIPIGGPNSQYLEAYLHVLPEADPILCLLKNRPVIISVTYGDSEVSSG